MDHVTTFLDIDHPTDGGNPLGVLPPPLPTIELLTPAQRAFLAPLPPLPATVPGIRFEYRRQYSRLYTTQRLVLRQEHADELKRLSIEHQRERPKGTEALTPSDIVNAAVDFAFEHLKAFNPLVRPENLSAALAREVYRAAITHFWRHEAL